MNDPWIDRLERLERENRRLRWTVHATLAIACLILLAAQAAPRATPAVVEATAFHLLDPDGRVRTRLGFSFDGRPQLIFRDDADTARATLEIETSGAPRLSLSGADGKPR